MIKKIKNVVPRKNKDGTVRYYRREVWRENGKQMVRYHDLPDIESPDFYPTLDAINAEIAARKVLNPSRPATTAAASAAVEGYTVTDLIREFKPVLAVRRSKKTGELLAENTIIAWRSFLSDCQHEHGHKLVHEIERQHCYKIRNGMAETPGKANNYMSKFKGLLEFASEIGKIPYNPALKIELFAIGSHDPWPPEVIIAIREKAGPALNLGIVSALCSGQRISDIIRMEHDWMKGGFMCVPESVKTKTPATIPMHPIWLAEIDKMKAHAAGTNVRALTILFDAHGKPFSSEGILQNQLNYWMKKLGFVDDKGAPLYSFHGLSKNAICYLAEAGLTDETISAIVGKTVDTVRIYSKNQRKWMLAKAAEGTVISASFDRLVTGQDNSVSQLVTQ